MPGDALPLRISDAWLDQAARVLLARGEARRPRRWLVGIAGIPGSGKSTLAARLAAAIEGALPGGAAIAALDGFHRSNAWLAAAGLRDRKGAPETFDAAAYVDALRRGRKGDPGVAFPTYSRERHEPVAGSPLGAGVRVVIAEGNYLLLDEDPWAELAALLDECWLLETPAMTARQWILARHARGGRSPEDAGRHYDRTDAANTRLVLARSRAPTLRLAWPPVRQ